MSRSRNASNPLRLTRRFRAPSAALLSGFALLLSGFALMLSGCSRQPVSFDSNSVFAAKLEHELGQPMDAAEQDVQAIMVDLFGTPDAPRLPAVLSEDASLAGLMDPERLTQAAGAVASDREGAHVGLYREHCSTCHGISGDGRGPAALFQNPYPRDYRPGIFKYKSTPRGAKPTRQDLANTILYGLPGTGMPAFELLAEFEDDADGDDAGGNEAGWESADIEALLDYVIYLSIRGELERRLLLAAATEFDYTSDSEQADRLLRPPTPDSSDSDSASEAYAAQAEWIAAELREIAGEWAAAEEQVPAIPTSPAPQDSPARQDSIALGRELFHGQIANCSSCHGVDGAGGTLPADYDDWTKEWTTQLGLDPENHDKLEPFLEAGALPPRRLPARRLTLGGFRGGTSPADIYLRIVHGIDGTPMPAINLVESESPTGLTSEQVWHLVDYVLSLDNFAPSTPSANAPEADEIAAGEAINATAAVPPASGASR